MNSTVMEVGDAAVRPDQRPVVKTATAPLDRSRLAHEADVLDVARHPGVVELLGFSDGEQWSSLTTARVSGPTLAHCADTLGVRDAAGVVAALAQTVADLHNLGVVHGRVDAGHVIIAMDGRPVLSGFGQARHRRVAPPGTSATAAPASPAGDVAALGTLLRHLVGHTEGSPIPDQRRLRRARSGSHDDDRRTLLTLADHATHDDPTSRPSAGEFAAALLAAVPDASLPQQKGAMPPVEPTPVRRQLSAWSVDRIVGSPLTTARRRPGRLHRLPTQGIALGLTVVLLAVFGARVITAGSSASPIVVAPDRSSPAALPVHRAQAPSPTTPPTHVPQPVPATSRPNPGGCLPVPPLVWSETTVDVDGDGCLDPVSAGDGAVRTVAHRYVVGAAGDPVVVGDWDCNGTATPATVHRASGELFVFEDWAEPGHDVSVPPEAEVPADATLAAGHADGQTCPVLEVHEPGRAARIIGVRPASSGGASP